MSTAGRDTPDEALMKLALREAIAAMEHEDVPIGAVVVHEGRVIGRGHNQREQLGDPTAHAEMIAITAAAEYLHSWRLTDCTLYVTAEPCLMCAGAMLQARLPRLVFGAEDPKAGACGSVYTVTDDPRLNHRIHVTAGVMAADCADLLQAFFREQRRLGKK
jgi:tRNA(adenine34) deaminase